MGIAQYKSPAIGAHHLGTVTNTYRSRFKESEVSLGARQSFHLAVIHVFSFVKVEAMTA